MVVYRSEDTTNGNWEYTASTHCGDGEITDMHIYPSEDPGSDLMKMNIYICLCNPDKMWNSSFVTFHFRKLRQRPTAKRLSLTEMRERYQASQSMSTESTFSLRVPKLNLIAFNKTHTQNFLPLNENN